MSLIIPGMTGILAGASGQYASSPPPPTDPWDELTALGTTDGWRCMYDFNNPDTWTLRDAGGGSMFYTEVRDGLGNEIALTQATTGSQPGQTTLSANGSKYFGNFDGGDQLFRATGTHTSPRVITMVLRSATTGSFQHIISPNSGNNQFATTNTYAYLISDGSSNRISGNNVFGNNTLHVVSAVWNSNTNNAKVRVNGSQVYENTLNAVSLVGLRLGVSYPGQIGFCAVYNGLLTGSSDALSRMEDKLKTLYGI